MMTMVVTRIDQNYFVVFLRFCFISSPVYLVFLFDEWTQRIKKKKKKNDDEKHQKRKSTDKAFSMLHLHWNNHWIPLKIEKKASPFDLIIEIPTHKIQ